MSSNNFDDLHNLINCHEDCSDLFKYLLNIINKIENETLIMLNSSKNEINSALQKMKITAVKKILDLANIIEKDDKLETIQVNLRQILVNLQNEDVMGDLGLGKLHLGKEYNTTECIVLSGELTVIHVARKLGRLDHYYQLLVNLFLMIKESIIKGLPLFLPVFRKICRMAIIVAVGQVCPTFIMLLCAISLAIQIYLFVKK